VGVAELLLAGVILRGVFGDPIGSTVALITGPDGWLEVKRPILGEAAGAGTLGIVFAILKARTAWGEKAGLPWELSRFCFYRDSMCAISIQ
jgi:hypothetical protein